MRELVGDGMGDGRMTWELVGDRRMMRELVGVGRMMWELVGEGRMMRELVGDCMGDGGNMGLRADLRSLCFSHLMTEGIPCVMVGSKLHQHR